MYSQILRKDIEEESLSPGYFFYGAESYLAERFLGEMRGLLIPPDAQDFRFDVFYLDETKWADILDTARTMPFFFSPWRIIVVKIPEKKSEAGKPADKETKGMSAAEGKLIQAYFSSPPPRTVMTIMFPGKRVNRTHSLVRFFSALSGMTVKELKPLRDTEMIRWIEAKAGSLQKTLTPEAGRRLYEIVGSDLRLMDNEIDKLAVYADDKSIIDVDDVNQISAWIRSYDPYELDDSLAKADFRECLIVLDNLFKAGEKPEQILFRIVVFFRNILMAQTWLREKARDKKEIFKQFFPQISEKWTLYQRKSASFFSLVEGIPPIELTRLLNELGAVDARIKTSDVPPRTAFEAFFFQYCGRRIRPGAALKARG